MKIGKKEERPKLQSHYLNSMLGKEERSPSQRLLHRVLPIPPRAPLTTTFTVEEAESMSAYLDCMHSVKDGKKTD